MAIFALALVAAVPLLLPPVQALTDLPAHLAQFEIAHALPRSPALARFFAFEWQPIPNLGVDVTVAALAPFLGASLATRLVVAAIPALTVAGLLCVARTVHGGRVPATSLMALPLAYSYPLAFGFLNSSLAVALALLVFAAWLHLTQACHYRARMALSLIAAPLLLFTHIIGYGVFGLLAGSAVLVRAWRPGHPSAAIAALATSCLPLLHPLIFLLLWSHGDHGNTGGFLNIHTRLLWMLGLLRDGWAPFDLASAAGLLAVAALPVWRPRAFCWHAGLGLAAGLLWVAALVLPNRIMGSEYASVRLFPVACAVSLLAVAPRRPLPAWAMPAAVAFVALRLAGNAAALLLAGRAIAADLAALPHVAPDSRVIAFHMTSCTPAWAPARRTHIAAYATVRRHAFVNDNFGQEAGQLLRQQTMTDPYLGPLPAAGAVLERWPCRSFFGQQPTIASALAQLPTAGFDYLWLIDVPMAQWPRRADLQPIWHNSRTVLYRRWVPSRLPSPPAIRQPR